MRVCLWAPFVCDTIQDASQALLVTFLLKNFM
jgi:hypothetical protein